MNRQVPLNFSTTCGGNYETGQSSGNNIEDAYHFPDSGVPQTMNPWLQISCSLDNISTAQLVDQDFQDTFAVSMEVDHLAQTSSSMQANTSNIPTKSEFSCDPNKGQSTGTKGAPDHEIVHQKCQSNDMIETSAEPPRSGENDHSKRKRSAKVHNFCERRRRYRIKQRIRTLQELIPNCNKADKVFVLDNAINYLKALKLQVEMMTSRGGVVFQNPSGIQSTQVSQFFPSALPMMPNFGWDMCYSTGYFNHSMIPVQSGSLHPSQLLAGGMGWSPVSNCGNHTVPHPQMPFNHSQQSPLSFDTSAMLKQFVAGESACQAIPRTHSSF